MADMAGTNSLQQAMMMQAMMGGNTGSPGTQVPGGAGGVYAPNSAGTDAATTLQKTMQAVMMQKMMKKQANPNNSTQQTDANNQLSPSNANLTGTNPTDAYNPGSNYQFDANGNIVGQGPTSGAPNQQGDASGMAATPFGQPDNALQAPPPIQSLSPADSMTADDMGAEAALF